MNYLSARAALRVSDFVTAGKFLNLWPKAAMTKHKFAWPKFITKLVPEHSAGASQ
jgi:hypothetical protein